MEGKITDITLSQKDPSCYMLEIALSHDNLREQDSVKVPDHESSSPLQFTLCSESVNSLPQEAANQFLKSMTFMRLQKGDRFIRQGDEALSFYLILQGSCTVLQEKDNVFYRIAQLGAGDVVGEMSVFTGELHNVHVDADTDLDLLRMGRDEFERLSGEHPQLRNFLSEIITQRLSTAKVTAERKIGKYVITEKIGHGGSSIIYRGTHSMLNMPVAIKMLTHDMSMDPDFVELFRNEAKIIAQLNHPHIVKVYDIEERYRTIFIIMEYLDGMTLKDIVMNGPKLSAKKIVDITIQACFGLEYAHKHGIIHQDINPKNLFIKSDGQVKIIDFGLACNRGCIDPNFLFPGTIFYIAPEQIQGDPIDERTDIYAFGTTVYEMIAGQPPVSSNNMREIINWHLNEDIPDTRSTMPDLPDELHTFLMRTIRRDPASRYKNVSEMLDTLHPLAEKLGVQVQPRYCTQSKMIGMFLTYQEEQQLALKQFIEEFNKNVKETGGVLRITQFDDL
jgi:serine/threonine protein kinase